MTGDRGTKMMLTWGMAFYSYPIDIHSNMPPLIIPHGRGDRGLLQ